MQPRPYRGPGPDRPADLPLPPERAPLLRHWRLHEGWCYVGVWSETVSVCAVRVRDGAHRLDLVLEEGPVTAFEVVTPVGRSWTWTREQAVRAHGTAVLRGRHVPVDGVALVDDDDGYHPRRTHWWWSGGTAQLDDGRTATWSIIVGLDDQPPHRENTLWLDGRPQPLGPVTFAPDLSRVTFDDGTALTFTAESERASLVDLLVIRSAYRQPFGTFTGTLPGGLVVRRGSGVMEDHRALW